MHHSDFLCQQSIELLCSRAQLRLMRLKPPTISSMRPPANLLFGTIPCTSFSVCPKVALLCIIFCQNQQFCTSQWDTQKDTQLSGRRRERRQERKKPSIQSDSNSHTGLALLSKALNPNLTQHSTNGQPQFKSPACVRSLRPVPDPPKKFPRRMDLATPQFFTQNFLIIFLAQIYAENGVLIWQNKACQAK